jgi:hypothetical protein
MKPFATLPPAERALIINEAAGRLGLAPLILEKDFWVCWTLGRLFEVEAMAPMFVGEPVGFDALLQRLETAEQRLNDGSLFRTT